MGGLLEDLADLLSGLRERARPAFQDAYDNLVGACAICGEQALPLRCRHCGDPVCLEHVYLTPKIDVAHLDCVCSKCVDEHLPTKRRPRRGKRNPFEVLGIEDGATEAQINTAFRKLAKDCHPDLHPGDSEAVEKFRELQRARDEALRQAER